MQYSDIRIKLKRCDYTKVIEYYQLLNNRSALINADITKIRFEYLYRLYNLCSDDVRDKLISHIESNLNNRLGLSICIKRKFDDLIELSKYGVETSNNIRLLGELLPVVLVLEQEIMTLLDSNSEKYDISKCGYKYLRQYDSTLKLEKDDYDIYDVFNKFLTANRRAKFKTCIFAAKTAVTLDKLEDVIRRKLWKIF